MTSPAPTRRLLYIVDRKKDMIVTGGFTCSRARSRDVHLRAPPRSRPSRVVGVPDEKWARAVKACVVLRDGQTVEAAELVERVRSAKGSVHAPKSVDFVDALPLTPLGKLDKKALRAQFWEGAARSV